MSDNKTIAICFCIFVLSIASCQGVAEYGRAFGYNNCTSQDKSTEDKK
jgi:hypothetical protein